MDKADKALWADMKFYQHRDIADGRKHRKVQRSGAVMCLTLVRELELKQGDG